MVEILCLEKTNCTKTHVNEIVHTALATSTVNCELSSKSIHVETLLAERMESDVSE